MTSFKHLGLCFLCGVVLLPLQVFGNTSSVAGAFVEEHVIQEGMDSERNQFFHLYRRIKRIDFVSQPTDHIKWLQERVLKQKWSQNYTLAHLAAARNDDDMIYRLNKLGAELHTANLRGHYPVDLAIRAGADHAFEALLRAQVENASSLYISLWTKRKLKKQLQHFRNQSVDELSKVVQHLQEIRAALYAVIKNRAWRKQVARRTGFVDDKGNSLLQQELLEGPHKFWSVKKYIDRGVISFGHINNDGFTFYEMLENYAQSIGQMLKGLLDSHQHLIEGRYSAFTNEYIEHRHVVKNLHNALFGKQAHKQAQFINQSAFELLEEEKKILAEKKQAEQPKATL